MQQKSTSVNFKWRENCPSLFFSSVKIGQILWFTFLPPSLKVNHREVSSKCQSLYLEDNFIFYPQSMPILVLWLHIFRLFSYDSELDDIVAEAHQGCLNRKGTFPVWGVWESDQRGVKCAAVALINFPPLIVCSRPLRLLGLTRENGAAQRLCSGSDHFTAPSDCWLCMQLCMRSHRMKIYVQEKY